MQTVAVRCPNCGKPNWIPPAAASQRLQCPLCHAAYLAPPAAHFAASLPAASSLAAPSSAPRPSGPLPPHLAAAGTATLPQPTVPQPALAVASAANVEQPGEDPTPRRRGSKLVAVLYVIVFCMLLGIAAVTTGAIVVALQHSRERNDEVVEAVYDPNDPLSGDEPGIRWTSGEKALVRDDARVRITSVEYGEVLGRDSKHQPVRAGQGEFLKIYLKIDNRGSRRLRYTSWYGNRFREQGEDVEAELLDADDRSWPMQRFPGVQQIQGHTPQAELEKGDHTEDVLIFAGPRELIEDGRPLRLVLPAAAMWQQFGPRWQVQSGFYRFEIPASMLGKD